MELIEIGKISKPFGTEGLLRCFIQDVFLEDFLNGDFLFIKRHGQAIPYFMEKTELESPGILVQLEEIKDREAALAFAGKPVYLRPEDIRERQKETTTDPGEYEKWIAYKVEDLTLGVIGPIQSFLEMPQQVLAVITYQGREVLVPFQEQLIVDSNRADKTIVMDLPAGLLEL